MNVLSSLSACVHYKPAAPTGFVMQETNVVDGVIPVSGFHPSQTPSQTASFSFLGAKSASPGHEL